MFCPKCGTQNPETGRFCRSCGADLGNISAALTGNLTAPQQTNLKNSKPVTLESSITQIFMGLAFFAVAFFLVASGKGSGWWFWMLIPAFGIFGSGVARYIQLKSERREGVSFAPQATQNTINPAPSSQALPPTQTDYVAPPKSSIYDTGELAERPASVTEQTTRHLQMDSEGETMTLPKK